jgi:hypothetical protein
MKPLYFICLLAGTFLICKLILFNNGDSSKPKKSAVNNLDNIFSSSKKNPIKNDTIYIYRAYLLKSHPTDDIYGKWLIRMTAFSNCFEDEKNEDLFIENPVNGKRFEAVIFPTGTCYDKNWAALCYWGTKYIEAKIPEDDVLEFGNRVNFKISPPDRPEIFSLGRAQGSTKSRFDCIWLYLDRSTNSLKGGKTHGEWMDE